MVKVLSLQMAETTLISLSKKRSFMREHRDVSRKGKATEPLKDLEEGAGRHCPSRSLWGLWPLVSSFLSKVCFIPFCLSLTLYLLHQHILVALPYSIPKFQPLLITVTKAILLKASSIAHLANHRSL